MSQARFNLHYHKESTMKKVRRSTTCVTLEGALQWIRDAYQQGGRQIKMQEAPSGVFIVAAIFTVKGE